MEIKDFIQFDISRDMINEAESYLKQSNFDERCEMKKLRSNQYGSNKKRTIQGYIGEVMVGNYLGPAAIRVDYDEFDFVYKRKKIEVKCIAINNTPKLYYRAQVNSCYDDFIRKQSADFYIFCFANLNFKIGWIAGFISCDHFFEVGTFRPKGYEFLPGKYYIADATDATVYDLTPMSLFDAECENGFIYGAKKEKKRIRQI